ncbi:D-alanine-D-alanine ligase [Streptomyces viridosporus ATCC 14672]|uniref:D-alanine-D-alanine ligase n=1 Tax=Streptomyces viridosporus (strain ATCC 14672 / DSM 40746 / JCM 4963 / KCTC 9882 / NRRL B-12104 / FH 1290) TaxID=566461 RepID=D5ZTG9_STRV1|nr:D-alanine-D-alanine ligase [Streptomyces viridosporus ATCC 14672]EFE68682.1 D-alanine-D-alanine ligase [Streptomyces viridosporus ATCC 14672]EFE69428.1 D-alanine-D-alanine ligase [Streptomyces viridosporus ATCC 14672]
MPPRPASHPGTGSRSRTRDHSASLMSESYRGRRSGRSAAFPNRWARQSHPGVGELDSATTTTRHFDNRASCSSLDSTTASYQEALLLCTHTG